MEDFIPEVNADDIDQDGYYFLDHGGSFTMEIIYSHYSGVYIQGDLLHDFIDDNGVERIFGPFKPEAMIDG